MIRMSSKCPPIVDCDLEYNLTDMADLGNQTIVLGRLPFSLLPAFEVRNFQVYNGSHQRIEAKCVRRCIGQFRLQAAFRTAVF